MNKEKKANILILGADGFEDSELVEPMQRLREAGFRVEVASLHRGTLRGKHGTEVEAALTVEEVVPHRYAGLLLPGGKAPAKLRAVPAVQSLVRDFVGAGKPVAAICHGPLILLSAGVLTGRKATGYRAIAQELQKGGVHYRDRAVVIDGNLITSRHPGDLPGFIDAFLQALRHDPG